MQKKKKKENERNFLICVQAWRSPIWREKTVFHGHRVDSSFSFFAPRGCQPLRSPVVKESNIFSLFFLLLHHLCVPTHSQVWWHFKFFLVGCLFIHRQQALDIRLRDQDDRAGKAVIPASFLTIAGQAAVFTFGPLWYPGWPEKRKVFLLFSSIVRRRLLPD